MPTLKFEMETENGKYRFSIQIIDRHMMKVWEINQPTLDYVDIAYIKDTLDRLPDKLQEFVKTFARMILEDEKPHADA